MKQAFYLFGTLVVGIIIAIVAFNLNREYVDLRYTLSEKIPTRFVETSTAEAVQQLVVKNNGNAAATKIQIKINGFIKDHDILKNAVSDVVEENNSNGHFEAIYPSLPPDAQFTYIFKTSGYGIDKQNLEIKHNKGKAAEALARDIQSLYTNIYNYFSLGMILFIFGILLLLFRSMAIDSLESHGTHTDYHSYLNKQKPLYVSQEKWETIRRAFIGGKIKPNYLSEFPNIEESEAYKILNQDKPNFITEDEWTLLRQTASTNLEDQLSYSIKARSSLSNLEKYFLLKKPKHFQENKWSEIVEKINNNYIALQKLNNSHYVSTKGILKELERGMPPGMLRAFWDEHAKFLGDRYYELVYSDILRDSDPLKYFKEINLSVLNKENQKSLEYIAYKIQLLRIDKISSLSAAEQFLKEEKPEWIKKDDLEKLEKKAEAYIALDKSIKKTESLLNALNSIVNFKPLKEKPDTLDSSEWDKVVELERQIATTSMKIKEDKSNLETEKQKTNELKNKVIKQLSIIDGLLIDPKSIDKIEDYDNPFSEGNFENMKAISKLATELKKIT
jgi:hypothetical protein